MLIRLGLYRHYSTRETVLVEKVEAGFVHFLQMTPPAQPMRLSIETFTEEIAYRPTTDIAELLTHGYTHVRRYERLSDEWQPQEYL